MKIDQIRSEGFSDFIQLEDTYRISISRTAFNFMPWTSERRRENGTLSPTQYEQHKSCPLRGLACLRALRFGRGEGVYGEGSFVPERFNRIQVRRFVGGISAENDADQRANQN